MSKILLTLLEKLKINSKQFGKFNKFWSIGECKFLYHNLQSEKQFIVERTIKFESKMWMQYAVPLILLTILKCTVVKIS